MTDFEEMNAQETTEVIEEVPAVEQQPAQETPAEEPKKTSLQSLLSSAKNFKK